MSEEKEYQDTAEAKIILLLSGFVRELDEGKKFEELTFELAERINKMVTNKTLEDVKEITDEVRDKIEIVKSHILAGIVTDDTMALLGQCNKQLTELEKLKI